MINQEQDTKLESIITKYHINKDDSNWLKGLLESLEEQSYGEDI